MPHYFDIPDDLARYDTSRAVILPIPFDITSTWGKGADQAPHAIREASWQVELYDMETETEVYRKGIFADKPLTGTSPEEIAEAAERKVAGYLQDGKLPVTIGGEHSVSIGPVRACAGFHEDLSILHLDAHADRREAYEGSSYNHACVVSRMREQVPGIVSVGIRSMDVSEKEALARDTVLFARDIMTSSDWIARAIAGLTDTVYVTVDLDVFDPGLLPSTGTPEPGGLDWYQVTGLLAETARRKNIIGFDLVELCPTEHKASDFLAAKLLYKMLSCAAAGPQE